MPDAAPVVAGSPGSRLVGRAREVAHLGAALEQARAGAVRTVLVAGEPGVGKTRLVEELAADAAAGGSRVVWARAGDRDGAPPYWLWHQVLAALGAGVGAGDPLAVADAVDLPTAPGDRADLRFSRFRAVAARLAEAAGDREVVVVLDDAQVADEPSLLLLRHLVLHLRDARLLLVVTQRDADDRADATATAVLDGLAAGAGVEVLRLRGLDGAGITDLLADVGAPASPGAVEVVRRRTGGNPFLVRELGRAAAEGTMVLDGAGVPAGVLDVTRHRLASLTADTLAVLRLASVVGEAFSVGIVAEVRGQPVLALLGPIEEAVTAGFLVPGDRPGDYRFTHALVRDAIEAQVPAAEQLALHRAVAEAIERLYEGRLRPHRADLARHWARASLPGDRQRAVQAAVAAAEVAVDELAFEEAVRLYRSAVGVGGDELGDAEVGRVLLPMAQAARAAGDLAGWQELLVEVAERARRAGDADLLVGAALASEATGDVAADRAMRRRCIDAAAAAAGDPRWAAVVAKQAQAEAYLMDEASAEALSRRALVAAEAGGDADVLVEALRSRQLACSGPDGLDQREVLADRLLALAVELDRPAVEHWARLWHLDTCAERGRLAAASGELERLAACTDRVAGRLARWHLRVAEGAVAQAAGRFDEALARGEEAFALVADQDLGSAFGAVASLRVALGRHVGHERSGSAMFAGALPPQAADTANPRVSVFPALTQVLVAAELGDVDRARRLSDAIPPVARWRTVPALRVPVWTLGLLAALAVDDGARAAVLAECLWPYRDRHGCGGAGQANDLGPLALHLGRAAAAGGRRDEAVALLEGAVAHSDEQGAAGYAVECRVALAEVLLCRGPGSDPARAAALLDDAAGPARALGMAPFVARIDAARAAVSSPGAADPVAPAAVPAEPAGPADRSAPDHDGPLALTAREEEVAVLVAQGRTNRQIAEELFISERTAQNHVQHILTKLGMRNRSQVAAWVTRRSGGGAARGGQDE